MESTFPDIALAGAALIAPDVPAVRERLIVIGRETWRDRLRFSSSLATVAVVYVGLAAATFQWASEKEARATGGTSQTLVMEGISVVLVDSAANSSVPAPPPMTDASVRSDATEEPASEPVSPDVEGERGATAEEAVATPPDPVAESSLPGPKTTPANDQPVQVDDDGRSVATMDGAPTAVSLAARASRFNATAPVPATATKATRTGHPAKPAAPHVASVSDSAAKGPTAGQAGAGGSSADERGAAMLSDYRARLAAHLRRFRAFPAEAEERGLHGVATVTFTVRSDGGLASARLSASTGAAILDGAALSMVRRAAPFPPMPPALGQTSVTATVPIRFDR